MAENVSDEQKSQVADAPKTNDLKAELDKQKALNQELIDQRRTHKDGYTDLESKYNDLLKTVSGNDGDKEALVQQNADFKLKLDQLSQWKERNDLKEKTRLDSLLGTIPEDKKGFYTEEIIKGLGISGTIDHIERNQKLLFGPRIPEGIPVIPSVNPPASEPPKVSISDREWALIKNHFPNKERALRVKQKDPEGFKKRIENLN